MNESKLTAREIKDKPRSELNEAELLELEQFEFNHGPLSVLQQV
jgi:hypothetical protein